LVIVHHSRMIGDHIVTCQAMMEVFGPAVGELMAALAAQLVKPVGAVFALPAVEVTRSVQLSVRRPPVRVG
jgi:hypothetical protein